MTDNIINKGCCGNPSQCWEPCGDLGKSLLHTRASSKVRKQAVRDAVRRRDMTDNSPEYFDGAIAIAMRVRQATLPIASLDDVITVLRAAAAQAREIAELRQAVDNAGSIIETMNRSAESAESANRALQAEFDRLRDGLTGVAETFPSSAAMVRKLLAYTGTEPQEEK